MSTAVAQPETLSRTELGEHVVLGGIAFTSFSALLLELSLTRLFSVVLFYHFAFLAISIALLGLGAGGVFAHIWKRRIDQFKIRQIAMACSAGSHIAPAGLS